MRQQETCFLSYKAENGEVYFGAVFINHTWEAEQPIAHFIGDGKLQCYDTSSEPDTRQTEQEE